MKNRPDRRHIRYERAMDRAIERAQRSAAHQLALLNQRLGNGVGAQRERARLSDR